MWRNADAISEYLEKIWPKLERTGNMPDLPMERRWKGSSNPPVSAYTLDLMLENSEPIHAKLRSELDAIEAGRNGWRSSEGVPFSWLLQNIRYDAGQITTWRAGQTPEDAMNARGFQELCCYVALVMMWCEGGWAPVELRVRTRLSSNGSAGFATYLPPPAESTNGHGPTRNGTATGKEDGRRLAPALRRRTSRDTYRIINADFEALIAENPGMAIGAAEIALSQRLKNEGRNGSVAKIRKARAFVKEERAALAAKLEKEEAVKVGVSKERAALDTHTTLVEEGGVKA
jgi:hypothetical protein